MTEGTGRPQRYCGNCGTQARPGNAFCVSCGARLAAEANIRDETITAPVVRGSALNRRDLTDHENARGALYVVGALLSLVVAYLVFAYSATLGFLMVGFLVLTAIASRRHGGLRTLLEGVSALPKGRLEVTPRSVVFGGIAVVLLIGSMWALGYVDLGGSSSVPEYDIIGPSDTSTATLRSAVALVETDAQDEAQLEALCEALSDEFSERYPEYDAISVNVTDHFGPEGEPIGTMAYFTAEWAERDYVDSYGEDYSISCYP